MRIFRGIHHPGLAPACALTIGNFDGVHRGHQAMLALLHIVSQVEGLLAEGQTVWDLLMASFPAGTVSGAPKIRRGRGTGDRSHCGRYVVERSRVG